MFTYKEVSEDILAPDGVEHEIVARGLVDNVVKPICKITTPDRMYSELSSSQTRLLIDGLNVATRKLGADLAAVAQAAIDVAQDKITVVEYLQVMHALIDSTRSKPST